jgi:O-6-methylguanine DNA methyltransferase
MSHPSPVALQYVLVPWGDRQVAVLFDPAVAPRVREIVLPGAQFNRALAHAVAARQKPLLAEKLRAYLRGESVRFSLDEFDLAALTPFRLAVSKAAFRIPYGRVATYGDLARQVGEPRAARAVGQVMANNPLPIVIPCHRVVASNGALGGYSGGLHLKRELLALEGVRLRDADHIEAEFLVGGA